MTRIIAGTYDVEVKTKQLGTHREFVCIEHKEVVYTVSEDIDPLKVRGLIHNAIDRHTFERHGESEESWVTMVRERKVMVTGVYLGSVTIN